jgi:hypothetical protein
MVDDVDLVPAGLLERIVVRVRDSVAMIAVAASISVALCRRKRKRVADDEEYRLLSRTSVHGVVVGGREARRCARAKTPKYVNLEHGGGTSLLRTRSISSKTL